MHEVEVETSIEKSLSPVDEIEKSNWHHWFGVCIVFCERSIHSFKVWDYQKRLSSNCCFHFEIGSWFDVKILDSDEYLESNESCDHTSQSLLVKGVYNVDQLTVNSTPHCNETQEESPSWLIKFMWMENYKLAHLHTIPDGGYTAEVKYQQSKHNTKLDGLRAIIVLSVKNLLSIDIEGKISKTENVLHW